MEIKDKDVKTTNVKIMTFGLPIFKAFLFINIKTSALNINYNIIKWIQKKKKNLGSKIQM